MNPQDILTWLNGRVTVINISHNGMAHQLYHPQNGVTIEDATLEFIERYNIDIKQEIQ